MKFNTGSLSIGVREFSFVEDTGTVGLDDRFFGDVAVLARVEKTSTIIELQAEIQVKANLVCDRCAEEFVKDVKTRYRMVYIFSEQDKGSNAAEEITYLSSESTIVDISDDVRQYTALTIPFKVLCDDNCKGLCQNCGINLNLKTCSCSNETTDPRWEQLNKLLNQN